MKRKWKRRSWRVICPDGRIRAFPALTKEVADEVALEKALTGCRPFPDDPARWWKKKCPGGKHLATRARLR